MKKTILILNLFLCIMITQSCAKSHTESKDNDNSLGPNDFPELINTDIPGAPKLGKPILILGDSMPLKGEGMGWAAPAVWDWDGDGKQDLLIGEFGSGHEHGHACGNFVRVYKNTGSNDIPKFTDKFHYARYARYPHDESPNGTPISVATW